MYKQNVGPLDRATRSILGLTIISITYYAKITGIYGYLLFGLGLTWILEGIFGYCILYGLFNWSTKRRRS